MTDYTLGRTVAERLRHARMIALGDRKAPLCTTPALIGTVNDDSQLSISTNLMPFVVVVEQLTFWVVVEHLTFVVVVTNLTYHP